MISIIKKSRVAPIVIGLFYGSTVANAQNNRTISSDYTVTGWTIHSKNITVTNGAKLKMNVGGSISINKPYIINKGAELEILLSHN